MLGSKDDDEIRRRARLIREARKAARDQRRKNPTVAEYDAILGDQCGRGPQTRKDDERQKEGGS
jgi:hypothetical protein